MNDDALAGFAEWGQGTDPDGWCWACALSGARRDTATLITGLSFQSLECPMLTLRGNG
jgi:hypothetical protein